MTNIYLVRHGESTLNIKKVYYGWTDCDLSEDGIKQANDVEKIMEKINYEYIISSPLKRALNTAQIINSEKELINSNKKLISNKEIIIDNRLKEINFGDWENKTYKQLQSLNSDIFNKWCNDWKNTSPPQGESFIDLYKRVVEFTNHLIHNHKDENVLIVAHQGVLRIIVSYLLKLNEDGYWNFEFTQGSYSHIQLDEKNHCTIKCLNRR